MSPRRRSPELTVLHRIHSGSNAVYHCVDAEGDKWVYKPSAGERPLMDFPDGTLAAREIAAYRVSAALGWDLVPETVAAHGPGGPGMAQRWIEEADPGPGALHDPVDVVLVDVVEVRRHRDEQPVQRLALDRGRGLLDQVVGHPTHDPVDVHPVDALPEGRVPVLRGEGADGEDVVVAHATDARLRRIALFDHVINNADRKGGHVITDAAGVAWAIDHGLSFHSHPKLRTVLWGWAGQPLPGDHIEGLRRLAGALAGPSELSGELSDLLSSTEITALRARIDMLLETARFPVPGHGYPLPWPLF